MRIQWKWPFHGTIVIIMVFLFLACKFPEFFCSSLKEKNTPEIKHWEREKKGKKRIMEWVLTHAWHSMCHTVWGDDIFSLCRRLFLCSHTCQTNHCILNVQTKQNCFKIVHEKKKHLLLNKNVINKISQLAKKRFHIRQINHKLIVPFCSHIASYFF